MFANTLFLLGMWERAIRNWIGCAGTIRAIRGFRMVRFNVVARAEDRNTAHFRAVFHQFDTPS